MDNYNSATIGFWSLIALFVGVWVMVDASKRNVGGFGSFLWGLAVFLLLCICLPLWLCVRPPVPNTDAPRWQAKPRTARKRRLPSEEELASGRCPACGGALAPEDDICPSCGIHFIAPDTESERLENSH